jgi:hypothetical protein
MRVRAKIIDGTWTLQMSCAEYDHHKVRDPSIKEICTHFTNAFYIFYIFKINRSTLIQPNVEIASYQMQ